MASELSRWEIVDVKCFENQLEDAEKCVKENEKITKLQARGAKRASTFFIYNDRPIFTKDIKEPDKDMFVEISKYIEKHKILDLLKD